MQVRAQAFRGGISNGLIGSGEDRQPHLAGDLAGSQFIPAQRQGCGAGANEGQARFLDRAAELGILRQETLAGMDGLHTGPAGRLEDRGDI